MALRLVLATELPAEVTQALLEQALAATEREAHTRRDGKLSLVVTDEVVSRSLNKRFAGNDYATDVLSFDYFEDAVSIPTKDDVVGEIVICLPIAQNQAAEYGVELADEIIMLFVHGTLHILGHDHHEDEAGFQALQDGIMNKLKRKSRNIFDGNLH